MKTWKDERELQITSIFSFSNKVLKRFFLWVVENRDLVVRVKNEVFWRRERKRENCCKPAFSPFPTTFSSISNTVYVYAEPHIICQQDFFLYPHKRSWGGYTGVTLYIHTYVSLSVRPCVTKSCLGHNFKSIKASNFKLHIQIGHIVDKCSVQEP